MLATPGVPTYIASIENTKQFIVGNSGVTGTKRYTSDNIGCHNFCKTCSGASEYECLTCFEPAYFLTQSFFCRIVCDFANKVFYDLDSNSCLPCDTGCQECNRERATDCTLCEPGYLKHPDNTCHTTCQQGTFKDPLSDSCLNCHPTCKNCLSASNQQCTECATGLLLNLDGTCFPKCKAKSYPSSPTECSACHDSCLECTGGL